MCAVLVVSAVNTRSVGHWVRQNMGIFRLIYIKFGS